MRGPYQCIRMNIECLKMLGTTVQNDYGDNKRNMRSVILQNKPVVNKRLWVSPLALTVIVIFMDEDFSKLGRSELQGASFQTEIYRGCLLPLQFFAALQILRPSGFFRGVFIWKDDTIYPRPVTLAIDGWTDLMKIGRLVLDDLQCLRWKFSLQIAICMKRSTRIAPNLVAPVFPKDGWVSSDVWKTSKLQPSTGTHLIHHQHYGKPTCDCLVSRTVHLPSLHGGQSHLGLHPCRAL